MCLNSQLFVMYFLMQLDLASSAKCTHSVSQLIIFMMSCGLQQKVRIFWWGCKQNSLGFFAISVDVSRRLEVAFSMEKNPRALWFRWKGQCLNPPLCSVLPNFLTHRIPNPPRFDYPLSGHFPWVIRLCIDLGDWCLGNWCRPPVRICPALVQI